MERIAWRHERWYSESVGVALDMLQLEGSVPGLEFKCENELPDSKKRVDLLLQTARTVYFVEYKVMDKVKDVVATVEVAKAAAVQQIRNRGYAVPYAADHQLLRLEQAKPIKLVGVVFDAVLGTVAGGGVQVEGL
jgi:hypothetical protein